MRKNEKNYSGIKKVLSAFAINLIVLTVFWGGLLRSNYNADTVSHMADPKGSFIVRLQLGRYLIAVVERFLVNRGILLTDHIPLTVFLTLILLALCLILLQSVFEKGCFSFESGKLIHKAGYYACVSLVFVNVLFSECLMFTELCLFIVLSYLFATIGVFCYVKGDLKYRLIAFLFFLAGAATYQYSVIYAAMVLVFYYMIRYDLVWSGKAVIEEVMAALIPGLAGVLDLAAVLIIGKIFPEYTFFRGLTVSGLSDKLRDAVSHFLMFNRSSSGLLPGLFLPGLFSAVTVTGIVYLLVRSKKNTGILYFILAYIVCLVLLYALPFMNTVFTFPPRMSFCLYLFQGMTGLSAFYLIGRCNDLQADRKDTLRTVYSCCIIGYLWVQLIFSQFIVSGKYISNTLDRAYAELVVHKIEQYETQNGIEVTELCVINDIDSPPYYRESSVHADQINERIIGLATCSYIESVIGRHFEPLYREDMPEEIFAEYFADRDWESFDPDEQLRIVDNTAYWCIY